MQDTMIKAEELSYISSYQTLSGDKTWRCYKPQTKLILAFPSISFWVFFCVHQCLVSHYSQSLCICVLCHIIPKKFCCHLQPHLIYFICSSFMWPSSYAVHFTAARYAPIVICRSPPAICRPPSITSWYSSPLLVCRCQMLNVLCPLPTIVWCLGRHMPLPDVRHRSTLNAQCLWIAHFIAVVA